MFLKKMYELSTNKYNSFTLNINKKYIMSYSVKFDTLVVFNLILIHRYKSQPIIGIGSNDTKVSN